MIFDTYEYSSKGGRSYNEDAIGSRTQGNQGIFVVADGLGGHSFGELASACVRETLLEGFPCLDGDPAGWLEAKIADANSRVLALQQERKTVMKSTVAALYVMGSRAIWAHVGDSRLYFVHDGRLAAFTEDHSVAYAKYKAGEITRQQIAFDEDQSRLIRSLGGKDHNEPAVCVCDQLLSPGDAFLLCSDGAWEYLDEEEIAIDLLKAKSAKQWAESLLLRMMDRIQGGHDNLTVLTVILQ